MPTCLFAYLLTYLLPCMHACMYAYIHTYIYIYISWTILLSKLPEAISHCIYVYIYGILQYSLLVYLYWCPKNPWIPHTKLFPFSHDRFAGSPGDNPTATCGMYSSGDAEATRGKVQLVACLVSWSKDGQEPKMGISPQKVGEWGL